MGCLQTFLLCAVLTASPFLASPSAAQTPEPPADQPNPDLRTDPLQPDFALAALPTTLRMPSGKWAFHVAHRFGRALGQGDFGDLASDFFGFDGSAQIGLELRYGLAPGTQIGIHRTSERSIQIFAQRSVLAERDGKPVGLDAIATLEGRNNLHTHYQGAFGLVVSKNAGGRAALYAEPIWIANSSPFADQGSDNSTLMIGLGARVRVRPATYLMAEMTPRLAGFDPGVSQVSFGLETRAGGHLFQINVSNGVGTTLGQIARGGFANDEWYIGFNMSRKFF